jgi:hypothetical protein
MQGDFGGILSKLLHLRNTLTLSEAAQRISLACGEKVTDADLLQFAVEGHLRLSIDLVNGAYACPCVPVDPAELEFVEAPPLPPKLMTSPSQKMAMGGMVWKVGEASYQEGQQIVVLARGIFDLPMIGAEEFEVQRLLQERVGGVVRDIRAFDTVLLTTPAGDLFSLRASYDDRERPCIPSLAWDHPDRFHVIRSGLLKMGDLMVRREAIEDFERLLAEPEKKDLDRPLGTRERRNLLLTVAAACKFAELDWNTPDKTARILLEKTELLGVKLGLQTVKNYLHEIPAVIEHRQT